MTIHNQSIKQMPDIANDVKARIAGKLDWVGMDEIEIPVMLTSDDGTVSRVPARATAFVNLTDRDKRGIHMSRLYLHLDRHLSAEQLSPCMVHRVLKDFLDSHEGLSDEAMLCLEFDYMIRRPALVSDNSGWKRYPVSLTGRLTREGFKLEIGLSLMYSSTCPCSAALARQLIQEQFIRDFNESDLSIEAVHAWLGSSEGIIATPHAQRSEADMKVMLEPSLAEFPFVDLIDEIESVLATPVQSAVKREDEMEFARLNGQNLMFCEDAARRIQNALNTHQRVKDFYVKVSHFESLHPHNAVAVARKGLEGGY